MTNFKHIVYKYIETYQDVKMNVEMYIQEQSCGRLEIFLELSFWL